MCALSAIISHIPGVVSCGGSDCTNNSLIGVCTVNDLYQISHVEVTMSVRARVGNARFRAFMTQEKVHYIVLLLIYLQSWSTYHLATVACVQLSCKASIAKLTAV